jgi:hypothetical protein
MKLIVVLLFLISGNINLFSQELFIMSEAASSESKGRKLISLFLNGNSDILNYTSYLGLMYGVNGRLTSMNYLYFSLNPDKGIIGDADIGMNYRFVSNDKKQFHFRTSVFTHVRIPTKGANTTDSVLFAHDVLENNHRQENFMPYAGLAATLLEKKFAANLNLSFNFPIPKGDYRYGYYFMGGLAFGYLLLPRTYESYKDVNLNLYLESKGFYFTENKINGINIAGSGGKKAEVLLGGQLIFNSALLFELGYIRSFADENIRIQKNIFFTSVRYLFF